MIPNHAVKFAAYIFLGFSTYWVVGASMNLTHTGDIFDSFQFLPMVIFAMANTIVILIAIMDAPKYDYWSKDDVKELLHQIERNVEFSFR